MNLTIWFGFKVSTHSRLKAAGDGLFHKLTPENVSTHSRLKAAGVYPTPDYEPILVSTHSRLKAAGCFILHKRF